MKTQVFNAVCENGQVTVNGAPVPGAVVLSAGAAKSQGAAVFSGPSVFYIAVPMDTLDSLIDLVGQLADAVKNGVLASNGGGAITSPTFATGLEQVKQNLQTLKGAKQ